MVDTSGSAGGTIDVYGGTYDEQALSRDIYSGQVIADGTNFGLLVAKSDLTIQGVDASGARLRIGRTLRRRLPP